MAKAAKSIYPVLKILISEKGYSQKEIAQSVDMHPRTFCEKLKGKYSFSLDEAIDIKEKFFPDVSMDYLYSKKI